MSTYTHTHMGTAIMAHPAVSVAHMCPGPAVDGRRLAAHRIVFSV